jgi:hypothetical protein
MLAVEHQPRVVDVLFFCGNLHTELHIFQSLLQNLVAQVGFGPTVSFRFWLMRPATSAN